jgi:hypothetical protein
MKKLDIINHIITECSLDDRIVDGMFNPLIQEHMNVLIEKLLEMNIPEEEIKELNNKIVEGKYPERQAYNKEGFLVTFPTPDYKAKALSSGNYFNYDPTHGRGGMHLIKKASPDEIQSTAGDAVQEPVIATKPNQQDAVSSPSAPNTTQQKPTDSVSTSGSQPTQAPENKPVATTEPIQKSPDTPQGIAEPNPVVQKQEPSANPTDQGKYQPSSPDNIEPVKKKEKEPIQYVTGEPEGEPLDLTDFSAYKDPSLEWAHNQKWEKKENGNYYDDKGTLRAVIGLDGSAVPATENDRASLRRWIDKKRKERLPGEKY